MAFGYRPPENHDEVLSEINVTPFVDVMLVLLIILILAVPVISHTVKLDLPQAQTLPDKDATNAITIAITRDGTLFWEEEMLGEKVLEKRLQSLAQQDAQPEIRIRGDRQAEYGHIVRVMATAQRAGIRKVGFMTQPD
ncbi:MAG: biopolymer transporter ExbD [Alistipes senegalensis]|nr:biopolymer transporter ExbD [Oxalobacter formigenes]MCM1281118.1 biopolymer transporter ExbD [Alistipes senegalensis]